MSTEHKTVLFRKTTTILENRPIAAFDFDSTLREYKSRGPPTALAVKFIAALINKFNIVIFTNSSEKKGAARVQELEEFTKGMPSVAYYVSTAHDYYRKPHTGMWKLYLQHSGIQVPKPGTFFCGDAAGRPGDFASSDATFAHNCGLKFVVPEKFFGNVLYKRASADPPDPQRNYTEELKTLLASPHKSRAIEHVEMAIKKEWKQVCVVMVGCQASGKTTIANKIAALGYTYISGDAITAEEKRLKEAARYLSLGSSVVIDATHRTKEARAKIAAMVPKTAVMVIVHVTTPADVCHHMNAARCEKTNGAEIPEIAFRKYWKELEEPKDNEAAAVVRIPFTLNEDAPKEVTTMRYSW